MYEVRIKRSAAKQLEALPIKMADRIARVINKLAEDPRPVGVRKLQGEHELYRIRVADYRVIYTILDSVLVIEVVKIGHRKDIYR